MRLNSKTFITNVGEVTLSFSIRIASWVTISAWRNWGLHGHEESSPGKTEPRKYTRRGPSLQPFVKLKMYLSLYSDMDEYFPLGSSRF